jgi:hypothetical protein
MSQKNFITLALAACVLVAFTWQRRSLAQLRQQNETLLETKEEAVRLASENEELPKLRAANNSDQTGVASTDLLRLRNEARQLRAQLPELGRLRAENGRLAAEISSGIATPQRLSEMEGFVAKESWSNAGFDTPEATVQTFFWAIREGDLARMAECMPSNRQYLLQLMEPGHEQEREKTLSEFQGLTQGSGFRIVNHAEEQGMMTRAGQSITEGTPVPARVTLGLQAAAGGAVIPLQLSRERDGWKVKGFF